jgi:hypothetical protein
VPLPDACAAIKLATVAGMRGHFPLGDRALWLAQPKSIPLSDELYDLADIGISLKILFQFLDPLLQRAVFTKQQLTTFCMVLIWPFAKERATQPGQAWKTMRAAELRRVRHRGHAGVQTRR